MKYSRATRSRLGVEIPRRNDIMRVENVQKNTNQENRVEILGQDPESSQTIPIRALKQRTDFIRLSKLILTETRKLIVKHKTIREVAIRLTVKRIVGNQQAIGQHNDSRNYLNPRPNDQIITRLGDRPGSKSNKEIDRLG